ncbi:MAG: BON domain-containing protein [Rhodospirillaceae bacterium]|nr:BON domain-containing protein [Rhodospirillaceae bacterium]
MFRPFFVILPILSLLSACAPVVLGAGATVGVAATEDRGVEGATDDLKIRAEINELWFRHDATMFHEVDLRVHEGRVMLTGAVQKPEYRVDAVRLAWQAAGVREVLDEIQVTNSSSFSDYSRDVIIATDLRGRLMFDGQVKNVNYSVEVVNGIVYLMGVAQNQAELDRVIAHARDIRNVKRVVSHVVLKGAPQRSGAGS